MSKTRFNLEERTFIFAKNVALFSKNLPRTVSNIEYQKQVIRSVGSIGANYIEAHQSLHKKDFLLRIKICRKEAKESANWLQLIQATNDITEEKIGSDLIRVATELRKILSTILINSQ